jgi:hypothetical protein
MSDRVSGFLINAQQAAKDAGHEIEINLNPIAARQWMLPTFSPDVLENIVRKLPRGLAVEGREGPDGRRFAGVATAGGSGAFYPCGRHRCAADERRRRWRRDAAARLMVNFG